MNHTMHGIIFSYGKPTGLGDLIAHRIPGSMPFGGNYRVVDFMLSNMVNAGIHDVGVIMHGKCQSMLDHLGNGRSWDLSRNRGGLTLLPAFAYAESRNSAGRFRGKVEALGCVLEYLREIRQEYVVLADSDLVINLPLEQVLQAQKQPLSRDRVDVCMRKTGNTPFAFEQLAIEMDEDVFLPVQALNALRREALLALEEKLLQGYRRDGAASPEAEKLGCGADKRTRQEERREAEDAGKTVIVSLENRCLLPVVLRSSFVHGIYVDSSCYTRDELWMALLKDAGEAHLAGKKFYYILPAVFRSRTAAFYRENIEHLKALPLDGFVAKSYDAAAFVRQELGAETPLILDHSLYSWNSAARDVFLQLAPERDTVPLELNRSELFARDNHHSEAMVYGYLPLMTSAQCVHANTEKCDRERGILYLKDRYGKYFPVKNNCTECYNTIYNTTPLMLFDERADFLRMGIAAYRISFTIEEEEQAAFILDLFERTFLSGKHSVKELFPDGYTRGHYKRGVE